MRSLKAFGLNVLSGMALALASGAPVHADDTEIFVSQNGPGNGIQPNILFVIDTSGSMGGTITTQVPFDPLATYAGTCRTDRIYWRRGSGSAPRCEPTDSTSFTTGYFAATQFKCQAAKAAVDVSGYTPQSHRARMWRNGSSSGTRIWEVMRNSEHNQPVECQTDAGIHGDGVNLVKLWARNGTASPNQWTDLPSQQINWSTTNQYIFYSGNYLNWRENFATITQTRLEIVQNVATSLLQSVSGVNVGLMRYSSNAFSGCPDAGDPVDPGPAAEGGMVTYPVTDIASGSTRQDLIDMVNSYSPSGCTPLSETLYEATKYFMGTTVDYGVNSRVWPGAGGAFPSVPGSREPADTTRYNTPMDEACQKNFIVYLTDGEPTADNSADAKILALPGFTSVVPDAGGGHYCGAGSAGRCLDDLAEYLYDSDLSTGMSGLNGIQNVVSYWIGFGPEVQGSALLQATAQRGGGEFFTAADTATLSEALTSIVTEILDVNTTFTAPAVSVNAFNRTQTLDDLYVSVFHPAGSYRWPGNTKKYRLFEGEIVDSNGDPAIDPSTGFFLDTAQSYWSSSTDGADVALGGAASRQPGDPNTRKVYTYLGNASLTNGTNAVTIANAAISNAVLGIGGAGDPSRDDLINWTRGHDVLDLDSDSDIIEARLDMGDPLHAKPAVVIYGGSEASPDPNDAVVYAPTNDGYLHAIDVNNGSEHWAFIPPEMLSSLKGLYENDPTANKHYGLDAEVRILKFDLDQNGVVETSDGDKVFLFFGMGRGGRNYYALDVTDRNSPRYLWTRTPTQLGKLGQTWSAPRLARVNVSGATQNNQKLVLIFGGGYDDSQDNVDYNTDTIGNAIYMIDAVSGNLLWSASDTGSNRNVATMTHSIPGNITVIDMNGDSFADRMYAADMGGRIFRFDIFNGAAVNSLVTGGLIADLGAASLTAPQPRSAARRFYNAPDVARMIRRGKSSFYNVALGSGYRGHPLNAETQDRFYSIRDYSGDVKLTQADYDALTPIMDGDLVDITDDATPTMADDAPGWRMELRLPGGWEGEKVLVESRTVDNKIFFTTYLPGAGANSNSCSAAAGAGGNRAWVISAFDGAPMVEQDGDVSDLSLDDRFTTLNQGGIAPEVVFLFPDDGVTGAPPTDCAAGDVRAECKCVLDPEKCPAVACISGVEVLSVCRELETRLKTYWNETGAN